MLGRIKCFHGICIMERFQTVVLINRILIDLKYEDVGLFDKMARHFQKAILGMGMFLCIAELSRRLITISNRYRLYRVNLKSLGASSIHTTVEIFLVKRSQYVYFKMCRLNDVSVRLYKTVS